jgi:hypothetical protein
MKSQVAGRAGSRWGFPFRSLSSPNCTSRLAPQVWTGRSTGACGKALPYEVKLPTTAVKQPVGYTTGGLSEASPWRSRSIAVIVMRNRNRKRVPFNPLTVPLEPLSTTEVNRVIGGGFNLQ